jgi:LmbE family N-acetylglucosaminyl deacetylase
MPVPPTHGTETRDDGLVVLLQQEARVLVVAPHPDDESLATGGLLQQAHRAGAALRVLLLTDGDNNPWPQRWLERRWRIDAAARRRWGDRRRGEAAAAIAALGLPRDVLDCLGWPDLGITDRLMHDTEASVRTLAHAIDAFAPTLLVLPSLRDSHPDHSACHVLLRLALPLLSVARPRLFDYMIHGHGEAGPALSLALDAAQVAAKREAVLAYASQVSLSRGRLLALVGHNETYRVADGPAPSPTWPWRIPDALRGACELMLVHGRHAWSQSLPPSCGIPGLVQGLSGDAPLFAKLRLRLRSPWIFDHWGWRRLR